MDTQALVKAKANSFTLPSGVQEQALTVETYEQPELALSTDALDALKRRFLIAYQAYGAHEISKVAVFTGISLVKAHELLKDSEVKQAIDQNRTACWTPNEIVAKICTEAENAPKPQDRLQALRMLMEFRNIAAPEGGSRNFKRTAAKYRKVGQ